MTYDVDYFIDKFSGISEALWCCGDFERMGARCASGHCGMLCGFENPTDEFVALHDMLKTLPLRFISSDPNTYSCEFFRIVPMINDGHTQYQQLTPKQRILAALRDIMDMQSKEQEVKEPKEKIRYVGVPVSITEQSESLILN